MDLSRNGMLVQTYESWYAGQNILIGIDSSKSNTAIVVGNEYNEILDDYEISGAGSDVNVYDLCWQTRKQLKTLFAGANIIAVGIEDIITKKKDNQYKGLDIHSSRAKITAVFDNIIFSFQEYFDITPRFINNQEWKSHTLPEEYRTRAHKKGSQDYFNDMGGRWAGRKDDVTDAVCILTYLFSITNKVVVNKIYKPTPTTKKYTYGLYPIEMAMPTGSKQFEFNNSLTFKQSMDSMVALMNKHDKYGYMRVPIEYIPIEFFYNGTLKKVYNKGVSNILIVVKIKEG